MAERSKVMTKRERIRVSIKKKREERGVTQNELAERLNISRTTVAMWETGNSMPRAETLMQLAKIFNCTVDELLRG